MLYACSANPALRIAPGSAFTCMNGCVQLCNASQEGPVHLLCVANRRPEQAIGKMRGKMSNALQMLGSTGHGLGQVMHVTDRHCCGRMQTARRPFSGCLVPFVPRAWCRLCHKQPGAGCACAWPTEATSSPQMHRLLWIGLSSVAVLLYFHAANKLPFE